MYPVFRMYLISSSIVLLLDFRAGAVYVFVSTDGLLWVESQKLDPSDGTAGDQYGSSVAIWNRIIVVGAYYNDNDKGTDAGQLFSVTFLCSALY